MQTPLKKIQSYKDDASKEDTLEIYEELKRSLSLIAIKNQKNSVVPDLTDEDTLRSIAYATVLKARRDQLEPLASLYWGIYNSRICGALELNKNIGNIAENCWADTLVSFKIASESGIAQASFNIGLMYENGWGVSPSKLIASDWFINSAERSKQTGSRESALEAALRVVPDLPAGQRLKAQLLK